MFPAVFSPNTNQVSNLAYTNLITLFFILIAVAVITNYMCSCLYGGCMLAACGPDQQLQIKHRAELPVV